MNRTLHQHCSDALDFAKHLHRFYPQCPRHLDELRHRQAPLPPLIVRDEALRAAEGLAELGLVEVRGLARGDQELAQPAR